jgi:hypothetical protein
LRKEAAVKSSITVLFLFSFILGPGSAAAQFQNSAFSSLVKTAAAQEKPDKPIASSGPVEVLKVWKIKSFAYRNLQHRAGEVPPDEIKIKPADKHFFLAIELGFAKGEAIVRTEPAFIRSGASEPTITDLIYTGSLGHRVTLSSTSISDSSGGHYLPLASVCGTGVYLVRPLGGIKATLFAPGMTDIGFPDDVGFAESGRFVVLYEVPAKTSGFKVKIGDAEAIALNVKT